MIFLGPLRYDLPRVPQNLASHVTYIHIYNLFCNSDLKLHHTMRLYENILNADDIPI